MAGIYIHVPFCKSKCTYCDFASFPKEIGKAEVYFACLYKVIKGKAHLLSGKKINTVYFGGGTPSFVEPKYIYGALKLIYTIFDVDKNVIGTSVADLKVLDYADILPFIEKF